MIGTLRNAYATEGAGDPCGRREAVPAWKATLIALTLLMLSVELAFRSPVFHKALLILRRVFLIFWFILPGIPAAFARHFPPPQAAATAVVLRRPNPPSWRPGIAGAAHVLAYRSTGGGIPETSPGLDIPSSDRPVLAGGRLCPLP